MARPRPSPKKMLLPPRTTGALPTHDVDGRPFVRLQTLGAVSMLVGTVRLGATAGTQFSLLLRVASAPGCQLARRALIEALWPDLDDARQRGNLRQTLYKLRGLGVAIALDGGIVALDPTQLLRTFSSERTADLFARDVTMGHEPFGPFLPGFSAPWPAFQEWLDDYRDAVHSDVRRVLSAQLRQRRERADWGGAEALARWLLQFDPLNEEGTLTVAECTALSGSKTEALAILDRYLAELGPDAGEIRLPASMLRRRIAEPMARTRLSFAPTERHFIGRGEELAELTLAMRRARWHDGSAMLWHGAPGIGKSRLAYELTKVAVLEGVRVLSAPCRESDALRPLSVFIDLVPELLSQPGALGCAPESLAVLRRLVPIDRRSGLPGAAHEMESVERTPDEIDDLPYREPMPMLAVLRSALIDLVSAVSHEKPTLFVVDDAHWIDESSWDVLADLIDRVGALRVCVVLMSREPHARLQRPQRVPLTLRLHALAPLSPESCLALSRAIGTDLSATIDDALGAWFVRASEGNPLFLRALVNHWIETGEAGGVPPTLHGVIEQRLSQLSGDALRVLQTAALLGKWATVERVGRVLELSFSSILDSIDQLDRLGIIAHTGADCIVPHELVSATLVRVFRGPVYDSLLNKTVDFLSQEASCLQSPPQLVSALDLLRCEGKSEKCALIASKGAMLLAEHSNPRAALRALHDLDQTSLSHGQRSSLAAAEGRLMLRAGDYTSVTANALNSFRLPSPESQIAENDADCALSVVDASYRSNPLADRAALLDYVKVFAHNKSVPMVLRLRAADMGMIMASNECDTVSAQALFETIQCETRFDETALPYVRFRILYETHFGDRQYAMHAAEFLFEEAKRNDRYLNGYHDALRAGFALRLVAPGTQHLDSLTLAFELAESSETPVHSVNAAWHLAQAHIELGRIPDAEDWAAASLERFTKTSEPSACYFVHGLLCRLAIEKESNDAARQHFERYFRETPRIPTNKSSTYSLALRTGVALLDKSWVPPQDLVDSLTDRHSSIGRFGTCDFLTSVIADAHVRRGDVELAAALIGRYTADLRRERGPLGARLRRSITQLQ